MTGLEFGLWIAYDCTVAAFFVALYAMSRAKRNRYRADRKFLDARQQRWNDLTDNTEDP